MTATASTSMTGTNERAIGVGLVVVATIAWSLSGVFTRLLTTDVWNAIAWRSFFGGLFLLIPFVAMNGRRSWRVFLSIGKWGLLLSFCLVICQACTIGALYFTTVANVTVIYATAPFLAAGIAWLLLGERIGRRTAFAGLVSLVGVGVIVAGSLRSANLFGDLLALGMTASFAFVIVIPRSRPDLPMMPATLLSAFVTMALFLPFGSVGSIDPLNWWVLAGFGLTNFTIALFPFLAGAKRIRSAEAALIGTLEIVLAPIWVWLLFSEVPGLATVIGGAMIFVVVIWHTTLDFRRPKVI